MNWTEALEALCDGNMVGRPNQEWVFLEKVGSRVMLMETSYDWPVRFFVGQEHREATDWKVYPGKRSNLLKS